VPASRKARRRARQRGSSSRGLLSPGPRWAALSRGIRRQALRSARAAGQRRNELAITALYAIAGALCLALAALLLTAEVAPPLQGQARLPAAPGHALRGTLIGAVVLGAIGVVLLGLAFNTLRRWWQQRHV